MLQEIPRSWKQETSQNCKNKILGAWQLLNLSLSREKVSFALNRIDTRPISAESRATAADVFRPTHKPWMPLDNSEFAATLGRRIFAVIARRFWFLDTRCSGECVDESRGAPASCFLILKRPLFAPSSPHLDALLAFGKLSSFDLWPAAFLGSASNCMYD